eukprot:2426723-Amphidinium_carterae.1
MAPKDVCLGLYVVLGFAWSCCADDRAIRLGIYAPFTSITHGDLASAVMFDLDFRKNLEPAIREAFGAPVIEVPNLHPDLRVSLQLGTSDSSKTVGVATTLDFGLKDAIEDNEKVEL